MGNNVKKCPWCGKELETRTVDNGEKIKVVCARCGYKFKEFKKPIAEKVEEKPSFVEVLPEERPTAREKPIWPYIVGGAALILIIVAFVKIFLL